MELLLILGILAIGIGAGMVVYIVSHWDTPKTEPTTIELFDDE